MTSVGAQELGTTRFCTKPGCPNEVCGDKAGPYVNVCSSHKAAGVEQRRQAQLGGSGVRAPQPERPKSAPLRAVPDAPNFEAKAKGLVEYGRKLDRALDTYRKRQAQLEPVKAALDEAMRIWRSACRDIAGDPAP